MNFRLAVSILVLLSFASFCSSAVQEQTVWHEWQTSRLPNTLALENKTITSLSVVRGRLLFVATPAQIFLYDGTHLEPLKFPWSIRGEPPVKRILDFLEDAQGNVYLVSVDHGVFKFDEHSMSFSEIDIFESPVNLSSAPIDQVVAVGNEALVIRVGGDLFYHRWSSRQIFKIPSLVAGSLATFVSIDSPRDSGFYALTDDGKVLRYIRSGKGFALDAAFDCGPLLKRPRMLLVDQKGGDSAYIYDEFTGLRKFSFIGAQCARSGNDIFEGSRLHGLHITSISRFGPDYAIAVGTSQGIWIADETGLSIVDIGNSDLKSDEVVTIEPAMNSSLLVGTYLGLRDLRKTGVSHVHALPGIRKPEIVSMSQSDSNNLFVATRRGLFLQQRSTTGMSFSPITTQDTSENIVFVSSHGSHTVIGHRDGRISRIVESENSTMISSTPVLDGSASTSNLSDALPVDLSTTVISTYGNGLYWVQNGEQVRICIESCSIKKRDNRFMDLVPLRNGSIVAISVEGVFNLGNPTAWETTLDGIIVEPQWFVPSLWLLTEADGALYGAYPDGRVVEIELGDSSPQDRLVTDVGDYVYSLESDQLGNIWIATTMGVFSLTPSGKFLKRHLTALNSAQSFDYGVSVRDSQGTIYFGGVGGLLAVDPNKTFDSVLRPTVYLQSVRNLGEGWTKGRKTVTPTAVEAFSSENEIALTLRLENPGSFHLSRIQYKLEGLEEKWLSTQEEELSYRNLPPGEYLFRAKGADATGTWSENEVTLPITVLPPWWQTWPAYGLYSLLACAFLFILKRASEVTTLRNTRDALELEVDLSLEREMDEIQAHLESVSRIADDSDARTFDLLDCVDDFLLTDAEHLASYKLPTNLKTTQRVQTLRTLQRHVIFELDEATANLRDCVQDLLDQFSQSMDEQLNDFIIVNDVFERPIPAEHAVYLAVVARELIGNAFQHAFVARRRGRILAVRMEPPSRELSGIVSYELIVDDNGIGYRAADIQTQFTTGGLGIVNRITDRFDGSIEVQNLGGTRVVCTLRFIEIEKY